MINTRIVAERLAERVAHDYIHEQCCKSAVVLLRQNLFSLVKEEVEDSKEQPRKQLFDVLFKAIDPYEKKFKAMIEAIWEEERKIIIANIKKLKKSWMQKDKVDEILYPSSVFVKKIENGSETIIVETMASEGKRVVDQYDFDMIFDVDNPEVKKWLKSYIPVLSKNLEKVSLDKLRATLIEGIEAGEGIPELTKRVNDTYVNWYKYRSENIARSETIRASNKAALNVYRQSGVVKKKIWITYHDRRTCPYCEQLDGQIISLEKNFYDLGDVAKVTVEGKTQELKLDYTYIDAPPLHGRCRCSVGAVIERE